MGNRQKRDIINSTATSLHYILFVRNVVIKGVNKQWVLLRLLRLLS